MKDATSINYWELLKELGIRYGKQVLIERNREAEERGVVSRLIFDGRMFGTAKEIYESVRDDLRVHMFDREFNNCVNRETYLALYLSLRDGGDFHQAAAETVRGEMLVAQMLGGGKV